ncbi:FAD-dependent oxidoreductase [Homoserinibacter sp. GY 40078]|uniref:FAD-dependent oxidoreductase n=1 Tax=Homoserinibacter sp. GY 40078 TaxID=2603275 RepID=UPI0011CB6A06|nr:FAD-dependent oxidoreductase [Homoserinibacter sp. GY 40078]TXK19266.1 FAD-dependent oxidoreductase [Homoserinibacter sp. GY 40078]
MIARLDRMLGRLTMYLTVIVCLGVIGFVALGMSIAGLLAVDPLALLASAAVLLVTSWIAGEVLARIFRSRAHTSSSVITALLLAFVLQPTLTLDGLLGLAAAAAAAAASKYLIAWRGRHVANPAAIGALVVGTTGLAFPSWWVGTGPLLPVVAIAAALVLWRTRRLEMGLTFIVLAAAITIGRLVVGGAPADTAVSIAFASSPYVFAAGFMLSEPLTLPPRRWQRIVVAVVAALVMTVPFVLGPISNSPELGLVVAGVVAFAFGQRRGMPLELVARRSLTPTAWEFRFRTSSTARFAPGQYLELTVPHRRPDAGGIRRVFSITSTPGSDELTIGVRIRNEPSSFKRALLELPIGARIRATGVWGDFLLPRDPREKLGFVAAGIGVTPFVAQLTALAEAGRAGNAELLYSVRSGSDLAYREELAATGVRVVVLAPDDPGELPANWSWAGPAPLDAETVLHAMPDAAERTVLISGAPTDVSRLRRSLRRAGARRIRTDVFLGY